MPASASTPTGAVFIEARSNPNLGILTAKRVAAGQPSGKPRSSDMEAALRVHFARRAGERGKGNFGWYEHPLSKRNQLTDCHAVACDDEPLPLLQRAHDSPAFVAKFSLGDASTHGQGIVALGLHVVPRERGPCRCEGSGGPTEACNAEAPTASEASRPYRAERRQARPLPPVRRERRPLPRGRKKPRPLPRVEGSRGPYRGGEESRRPYRGCEGSRGPYRASAASAALTASSSPAIR